MSIEDLIYTESAEDIIVSEINKIHKKGPISLADLEVLSYMKEFHSELFEKHEKQLVFVLGLFFKTTQPDSLIEEIYSIFSVSIKEEYGKPLTPVQASLFQNIIKNRYFSFSSPTSSGKSFLFRELIFQEQGDIVIVVPSRALIAEYISTVKDLLREDKSVLILQFAENVNKAKTKKRVYIITPERASEIFRIHKELNIQLFLFDEAQISEEKIRGMRFDSLVRRADKLLPNSKKVFAHPFISNPEAQLQKHNFELNSAAFNYEQLSVGKIYLTHNQGSFNYFSPFHKKNKRIEFAATSDIVERVIVNDGTILIYIAKAAIYSRDYLDSFSKYINLCEKLTDINALSIINELKNFIGASDTLNDKHSLLVELMERGIVIHHGSIPLYARLLIEQFVNNNFAKICFSTSTLIQGINMPFDIVWIDNYRFDGNPDKKNLDLKNLIGRAGRTSKKKNSFDYGYVIIESENLDSFCLRMSKTSKLKSTSSLDEPISNIHEDLQDTAEAIKNDTFNDELNLTLAQIERIEKSNVDSSVLYILDNFIIDGNPLTGNNYTLLKGSVKDKIKQAFRDIFICHLKRKELSTAELGVLSASIPILLWRIQGKSFNEIISLRHSYVSEKSKRLKLTKQLKSGEINIEQYIKELRKITLRYSVQASSLPNIYAKKISLFPIGTNLKDFQYDLLVYDTYDYLDKVISLSLADPLSATFQIYHKKHGDNRALILSNYIKYGTNDQTEIWLLRYGFGFEEIEWLLPLVESIDENQIVFKDGIKDLELKKLQLIERYV